MRGLPRPDGPRRANRRLQCDEIGSFCYAKDKNVATAEGGAELS